MSALQHELLAKLGKNENVFEVLFLDASVNDAETYAATLRNAGFTVHSHVATELIDFRVSLEEETTDIIICSCCNPKFNGTEVMQIVKDLEPDIPVIFIAEDRNSSEMREVMRKGAHDVIVKGDTEMLQLVFAREASNLHFRKRLTSLQGQLLETEHRCNILIDNSQDAIAYIHEGMHIHANPVYLSMFGFVDVEDLEGMTILDLVDPKDHQIFKKFLRNISDEVSSGEIEVTCKSVDSKAFDTVIQFSPAIIDGEACTQIIIRDRSKEKELEQKVRLLTDHDVDTGLVNRQHFIEKLNENLPGFRNGQKGALFYIRMDNMQSIRDKVGAAIADKLLSEIADILAPMVEEGELFGRFGDHTFTLFSEKSDKGATAKMAEAICAKINQYKYSAASDIDAPSCSIGIAYAGINTNSIQDFIDQAYQACESALDDGGNQWKRYDDITPLTPAGPADKQLDDVDSLLPIIDHALEHNRFRLFYQPVVSLQGDTRENYAVLVRMLNELDEPILPERFLSRAISNGKMPAIDRWIIKHAIEELAMQRKNGRKISFFISISGETLADDSLLLWICDCLRLTDAKGPWITFQIADKDIRTHVQQTRALVEGLKKIKCNLAIDRFGVTPKYESLLKHLPVDYIKLDPSFMQNLNDDPTKQKSLHEISEMAKKYEVKTIAASVEDANSLTALWSVDINYIQGYFLQEPSDTIGYDFNLG